MIPDPELHESRLDNGLRVVTMPMPWLHEVGVTLMVRAGSRFEDAPRAGVAHFLEHMLFKGTRRIPDPSALHAHLEALAADMNAATGHEANAYWLHLPPEHLEEGMAVFCEMFTEPVFAGIETERQVILAEMREDENDRGEMTNSGILGGEQLWPGDPLARPILGTRETISSIGVAALREYLDRQYLGGRSAVAFFGPVDHRHGVELAERALGSLPRDPGAAPPRPPSPMPSGPHWVAVDDNTSLHSLSLFFRTGGYRDPDFHGIAALRRLLDDGFSSRLQAGLREKEGLVYDIWANFNTHSDTGFLELGASVAPEHLVTVFAALYRELALLAECAPAASEWERIMTRWRVSLTSCLDRPSDLVERYVGDGLFESVESLAATWRLASALDPARLPDLARELTRATNLVVVLVGPEARGRLPQLQQCLRAIRWHRF
ncbi:MAG: insulinase family protein [Magnetococcales bacterium]|nr:insulinase family protein [Magnetococcales bacterium]